MRLKTSCETVTKLLCLVGLVAVFTGCCPTTKVTGRWQCGIINISVYSDGVASFSGSGATWSAIGSDAIRLEFGEKGDSAVAELRVSGKADNNSRTATINIGGIQTNCAELQPEEGK